MTFTREPISGLLSEAGCISGGATAGCEAKNARGLLNPIDVSVSPDGQNVYATSYEDQAVVEFSRNSLTGALTQLAAPNDCISSKAASECGTTTAPGLKEVIGLTISPDGGNVYVSGGGINGGGAIAEFERSSQTGTLKQLGAPNACLASEKVPGCSETATGIDGGWLFS